MRAFISVDREETAANGQRRIWARVCGVSGELVMVKVDQGADETAIAAAVNGVIAAQEQSAEEERARLEAELAAIQARRGELEG